jgi:hypothetical protein
MKEDNKVHPLVAVFEEAANSFEYKGSPFTALSPRQWQRWIHEGKAPAPASACKVGKELWARIRETSVWPRVTELIREAFPQAPMGSWNAAEVFGAWCREQATHKDSSSAPLLEILVESATKQAFQPLSLSTPLLPVHLGQRFRMRICIPGQPKYPYVFFVGASGKIQPAYPWKPFSLTPPFRAGRADVVQAPTLAGFRNELAVAERALTQLELPSDPRGWPFGPPAGLETFIVLTRIQPLRPEERETLLGRLARPVQARGGKKSQASSEPEGSLPPCLPERLKTSTLFHAFELVPMDGEFRDVNLEARKISPDPVSDRHEQLHMRLGHWYDKGLCLSFCSVP